MGKHTHRFMRQALYDLVWSEPRTHLAKRLGISDAAAEGPELLSAQLDSWVTWAIAQADRIDPVRSGRFIEAMQDPAED
ncbi:hypothetical protein MNBD_GAMMA13-2098 [hydrothermal vent metagenome]|uniref:Uncharacterized protein n=1 Tax=hydrothermal vent metagenome TaxID=652676 RepID=A0A3B0XWN8_9ZZZZ